MRHLNEQDLRTLLQSDENYYNSKRSNNQSFQNFIRILIVAFLGAFIANTPWDSLHVPILAYVGTASLIIAILLNIYTFPLAQKALEEQREVTHKTFNENDITYLDEIPDTYKKLNRLLWVIMICLAVGIVICPISYIVEKTFGPKEVKQMAKKQQSTQQPDGKTGKDRNERLWDTPSRPITPTPNTPSPNTPAQPLVEPTQPTQQPPPPAEPASDPKPSTEKGE